MAWKPELWTNQKTRTYHSRGGNSGWIDEYPVQEDPRRSTIRRMLQGSTTQDEFDHWVGLLEQFDQKAAGGK